MKTGLIRIICICVINFVLNYLLLFPLGLFKYVTTPDLKMFGIVGIVVSGIPALATLLFYKLIDQKPFGMLGFKFKRKDVMFSIISITGTIVLMMFVVMIASNIGLISAEWNTGAFTKVSFYFSVILVFVTWLIAAFYEELLFRGYFTANLSFLSTKKLYIMTSFIFMIFHIFKGLDIFSILILMVISGVFLYVYLKSGSLFPGTFAHMIFNFTTSHLVGNSDISLLKYEGDLGLYNLIFIIFFSIITIMLTRIFYRNNVQSSVKEKVNLHP
jgi:membrane protease YdiL (CAAX protease family)